MAQRHYAAVDLGAESGRVMLGKFDGEHLQLEEVHRFSNGGVRVGNHLYWDFLRLWTEVKDGLARAGTLSRDGLDSIGLDTWGVDFGLLDAKDNLIGNPYHYRDGRTNGMLEAVFEIVPRAELYAQTGIQFMQLNSLYQLYAMVREDHPGLSVAKRFLNMPDLFNFFLTGVKANEFTISTTTQCYNPSERSWAFDLLSSLGIPTDIFGEILQSGTVLGKLPASLAEELELTGTTVIAGAGHDTASAIVAVPASGAEYIYLSSGTWSLMGVELDEPVITLESLDADLTNEGGVGNKIRFLKNITGLWLVKECRRRWAQGGNQYGYTELTDMAARVPAFGPLIVPSHRKFLAPDDMPATIQNYCLETGQPPPASIGAVIRCVLESLALEYRWIAEQINRITGQEYPVIHIIGGGTQNKLLNQLAASATRKTVIAGPVEATAIGNILVQAMAMGEISSLAESRAIVKNSLEVETYEPRETSAWDEAFARYQELKKENLDDAWLDR